MNRARQSFRAEVHRVPDDNPELYWSKMKFKEFVCNYRLNAHQNEYGLMDHDLVCNDFTPTRTVAELEAAVADGDPVAMIELGDGYMFSGMKEGVQRDSYKACELYFKATQRGYCIADATHVGLLLCRAQKEERRLSDSELKLALSLCSKIVTHGLVPPMVYVVGELATNVGFNVPEEIAAILRKREEELDQERATEIAKTKLAGCSYRPTCTKITDPSQLKPCPCFEAFYCDKQCQTAHFAQHRQVCEWVGVGKQAKAASLAAGDTEEQAKEKAQIAKDEFAKKRKKNRLRVARTTDGSVQLKSNTISKTQLDSICKTLEEQARVYVL